MFKLSLYLDFSSWYVGLFHKQESFIDLKGLPPVSADEFKQAFDSRPILRTRKIFICLFPCVVLYIEKTTREERGKDISQ